MHERSAGPRHTAGVFSSLLSCHPAIDLPDFFLPQRRYPPFYDENPIGIYQKILAGKLDMPRHVDAKAKDIIRRLLTIDRTNRLGECAQHQAETLKRS